jgi:hypothetical protein
LSRAALLVLLFALTGCAHTHFARNAPGHVDVYEPPAQIDRREVEPPRDPGEQMIVASAGALAGGGVAFGGDQDSRGAYGVGPELSVAYGTRGGSHAGDDFLILPESSGGVSLGWTALSGEGEGVGPLYGELFYQVILGWLALGWAWDPDDTAHGPQGTLGVGPLYVRMTHLVDLGTQVQGGVSIKLPYVFVWSR